MVANKYFLLKFLIVFFINNSYSQKLFIPISDKEIISLYKKGEKSSDGSYIVNDEKNITRIKGKFDGKIPIDKWYIFFDDGNLMAHYNYSKVGKIDGIFAEYHRNGQLKTAGRFKNNKQIELWKTFYISDNLYFLIKPFLASSGFFDFLINSITASILSKAII